MNNLFMILKDSMILSFVFRDHQTSIEQCFDRHVRAYDLTQSLSLQVISIVEKRLLLILLKAENLPTKASNKNLYSGHRYEMFIRTQRANCLSLTTFNTSHGTARDR